jgi:hypothetical protein
MRRFIIASLMLLGFAGSALGQHRIVKLNSSDVQGQEPKANSITVIWDDGESRCRFTSILSQGPAQFSGGDSLSWPPEAQTPLLIVDVPSKDYSVRYFAPRLETEKTAPGDTILGHQTTLVKVGHSAIYYSRELDMALKIVTNTVNISEAMLVDQQADFDPRTVDLSGVEEAAARAEAGGHKDYARQIWRLVRRWQQAAANWPSSQSTARSIPGSLMAISRV